MYIKKESIAGVAWGIAIIGLISWFGVSSYNSTKYEDIYENQTISHSVQTVNNPNLMVGVKQVTQVGYDGSQRIHYKVGKKHGQEVSREVVDTYVTTPAKDEIDSIGTSTTDNRIQTYWYCWNSGNPSPHHLGYPVYGDHYCTYQELHNAGFQGY